jgi:ubiquinone biosynthesis protein UbiJ
MVISTETVAADKARAIVEEWLASESGEVQVDDAGGELRDVLDPDRGARADLERRIAERLVGPSETDSAAYLDRLRHDLSWHYDEVAYLRSTMQRVLNVILRPPALTWPGDEHPTTEAARLLSEALSPARKHQ